MGPLEWRDAEPSRPLYVYRRDAGDVATSSATPLVVLPVEKLGENAITAKLTKWDRDLNPSDPENPLYRWDFEQSKLVPVAKVPEVADSAHRPKGILLVVHGTFSLGQAIFDQLNAGDNRDGQAFLQWASTQYEHVLSFEHPTLSVSPVLNGLDLATQAALGVIVGWWYAGIVQKNQPALCVAVDPLL